MSHVKKMIYRGTCIQISVEELLLFCLVYREQTFDILFDGDEEEKSIATCVLDSILKVHG